LKKCNYSAGLRIYCADREKVIREFKNPIAAGDIKWIFERNCEGTEQLQKVQNRQRTDSRRMWQIHSLPAIIF